MIRLVFLFLLFAATTAGYSQKAINIFNTQEVERIEGTLSSDEMQGRKTGTPGIEKAADFIAAEFKTIGLKTFGGLKSYRQSFSMIKPVSSTVKATVNGHSVDEKNVVVFSSASQLTVTNKSGFKVVKIKAGDNFIRDAQRLIAGKENLLVFADTSFAKTFAFLPRLKRILFKSPSSVIFILTAQSVSDFSVSASQQLEEVQLSNIVGVLPGKSKKNETVVFSGHYDHLGIGKPQNGDSIYNGANDDASGITAVIMLAKYFKALGNNKRTIIFSAFTAEEIGGFGSQYFSRQLNPANVVAMFNIEMIGTESKWEKASAYITGYEKTNMGDILQKNLEGSGFKFYPDPYTDQNLFYRSDNATLARLGVPAHTISTSKMDNEPNYHKASDEIGTLDMANMTEIIKAIALSSRSIVDGKDAPTRVKVEELR